MASKRSRKKTAASEQPTSSLPVPHAVAEAALDPLYPRIPPKVLNWLARYFCRLSPLDRIPMLSHAQTHRGRAERAMLYEFGVGWRRWRVGLSRHIGDLLMTCVPPYMPKPVREELLSLLWRSFGPDCRHHLILPASLSTEDALAHVRGYFRIHAVALGLPPVIVDRYDWLQEPAATARIKLLDLLLEQDRDAALPHMQNQLSVTLRMADDDRLKSWKQVFRVANVELEISVKRRLKAPRLITKT